MMNGQANQLSEMVSVKTIQSEIGRYIKAGATSYLLVNTSDIRPVAMTARAVMEWKEVSEGDDRYTSPVERNSVPPRPKDSTEPSRKPPNDNRL